MPNIEGPLDSPIMVNLASVEACLILARAALGAEAEGPFRTAVEDLAMYANELARIVEGM